MAKPIANDDLGFQVTEDSVLQVKPPASVLLNDTDGDGDKLAARLSSAPKNPLFAFKTNGTFTYDARYHGALFVDEATDTLANSGTLLPNGFDSLAAGAVIYDSFTYLASDGQDDDAATVRVTIIGANDAPIAQDDSVIVAAGTLVSVDALANDTDVDIWPVADTLTVVGLKDIADGAAAAGGSGVSIVTDAGGTVTIAAGQISYQAASGFFGIDTFEYTVNDGNGGLDTGLVRVTVLPVNVGPVAVDDSRSVGEDDGATDFSTVLANDSDADDGDLFAADLVGEIGAALRRVDATGATIAGATGELIDFNSDGTFTYSPDGQFESLGVGDTALIAFDYVAYDGAGETDTATVTLTVIGANDNPTGLSPASVTVYEAGLATGSKDDPTSTGIPIVRDIDITIDDIDATDIPFVTALDGTRAGLTGSFGTLSFVDEDTVRYTLTSAAAHAALQGHNGGIFDTFSLVVMDEHGGVSDPLTVTVEIIDDINFLGVLPLNDNVVFPALDTLDDKTVAFAIGATTEDTFTLIAGADGQKLDVVGIPDSFTLADGRTVTSAVLTDAAGNEFVRGTDNTGATFYELTLDGAAGAGLGSYALEVFQEPPVVINEIDFSSVRAGGPQEELTVENITFDGYFFTAGSQTDPGRIFATRDDRTDQTEDVNPNNGGGIGIGNGNIERFEMLEIDVSASSADVLGVRFVLQGIGGGVSGSLDVLWVAVDENGEEVASGFETTDNINARSSITLADGSRSDGEFVFVEPGVEFAEIYVALDPNDVDGNDKVRINNIATLEQSAVDDLVLSFAINSDDGDGDQSPPGLPNLADPDSYAGYFEVTVLGSGTGTVDEGLIFA